MGPCLYIFAANSGNLFFRHPFREKRRRRNFTVQREKTPRPKGAPRADEGWRPLPAAFSGDVRAEMLSPGWSDEDRILKLCQFFQRTFFHIRVEAVAVGVHRDDGRKVFDPQ